MSRRPATALLAAAVCGAFAVVVWALAFHTHVGRAADVNALAGFVTLDDLHLSRVATELATLCNPLPYALLCAVVLAHTYRTRGPRGVLAALVILAAANVATQLLKHGLAVDRQSIRGQVQPESWPSGHSTASMALALVATIGARPARRLATAVVGGLFAIAVADSVIVLDWHFPSDALGGFAVAGVVTSLVLAAVWWAEERWPAGTGRRALHGAAPVPWPGVALGLLVAAGLIAGGAAYITSVFGTHSEGAAFALLAAAIGAFGLALAVACSRALDRHAVREPGLQLDG